MIMDQKNNIMVFNTGAELAGAAAQFMVESAKNAVEKRGRFVISLSGGHTPENLFVLLSKQPFISGIPWNRTFVFWGDERCVPADDKQNNARMAKSLLLDHMDIPAANIFPIPVDKEPAGGAIEYEQTIKNFFKEEAPVFDIVFLGLGENGHTASLFPGTDVLLERRKLVRELYVEEQKMYRITMTAPLINQARDIIFLVEGTAKAEVLNTVLNAPYQPEKYPAQLIKPVSGNLYWFADNKAATVALRGE
jgi:6-phosphogluconolactonase